MNPVLILDLMYQWLGFYGDWGGKGLSSGSRDSAKFDRKAGFEDPLDATFKDHDIRYYDAGEAYKNGEISQREYNSRYIKPTNSY